MPLYSLVFLMLAAAVNWTQFRGPNANPAGADARLPDEWSKTRNVEWAAEIPGHGWSSPILIGKKIFLTTATTDGKSKAPQMTLATPAIVGERLLIRTEGHLYSIRRPK